MKEVHVKNRKQGNNPVNIYLLKVKNRNTKERWEICSKLTIKTAERRQWCHLGVFIVNFDNMSHLFLMFLFVDFEQINVSWERTM